MVKEVALLFLKLGCIAFGGPAAHIALMRDEVVRRRRWVDDQEFLDLVGATHLIPGPNSTELAIYLGHRRAGRLGLIVAGVCFIVLGLAVAYVHYGAAPQAEWLLYGIKPVILAIILHALWGLGRRALRGPVPALVGGAVIALYLLGVNELLLLFLGGVVGLLSRLRKHLWTAGFPALGLPWLVGSLWSWAGPADFSLPTLFLNFLKIGAVLYGSGYVLLAFLKRDFVDRLGWLTDRQLLDAIAVGQLTPGPVFTTATFVGYVVGGLSAALVATIGIFLPSFVFVALLSRLLSWARRSPWVRDVLDGVNAASLGLMAGVTWQLARAAWVDVFTAVLVLGALVVVFGTRLNSAWIVLGGAGAGVLFKLLSS